MKASLKAFVDGAKVEVTQSTMSLTGFAKETLTLRPGRRPASSRVRRRRATAATTATPRRSARDAPAAPARVRAPEARVHPLAGAVGQPVEDDRQDDDGEAGLEGRADVDLLERLQDVRPRPGAPIRAVMTTIERAIMIVWLTPMPIVRRASGSWTLRSDLPAGRAERRGRLDRRSPGTPRMPSAVIRIAGGIA